MKSFYLQLDSAKQPLKHYWELCVGSCHATTALREDYREQLTRCQRELGFRYVRFHGLLDDDMSVLKEVDTERGKEYVLSFFNIDSIFDFLLSINMKPFIELGFMPECLKRSDTIIFHYKGNTAPPKDYDKWAWLIEELVKHLIDRYGLGEVRQWFFEVWNEPNLGGPDSPVGFWGGTMEEYFTLYRSTALAVKRIDQRLKVGGPATSNNSWIPEMVAYCKETDTPIDFISTHHYPTDVVLGYGVEDSAHILQPPKDGEDPAEVVRRHNEFLSHIWERVPRGVVTEMTKKAVEEAEGLPVYYTEWNSLAGLPSDGPFGSSFIAKTVMDSAGLVEGYSYWTFSDIFEEGGMPSGAFHGGFGLLTLQGIAKASYRAFQLLHKLGEERYEAYLADGTIDVYAVEKKEQQAIQLLAVNHHSLQHEIQEESVDVILDGVSLPDHTSVKIEIQRIDDQHANAYAQWEAMGRPEYLTPVQLHQLHAASELEIERTEAAVMGGKLSLSLALPPMGIALAVVYL